MRYVVLVAVVLLFDLSAAFGTVGMSNGVGAVQGIGCLLTQDWVRDDLKELGLRIGGRVLVRYSLGPILGTSPEAEDTTAFLFLSAPGTKGWLLFIRRKHDGTVSVIRNGYRVRREQGQWSASEGNGGIGTYRAMGLFAADLSRSKPIAVLLTPIADGCTVEH